MAEVEVEVEVEVEMMAVAAVLGVDMVGSCSDSECCEL
jgi:hypothetical protein